MGYKRLPEGLSSLTRTNTPLEQIAEMLDASKWGRDFDYHELEKMALYMSLYRIDDNVQLVREGSREAYMGILIKGRVKVLKKDEKGNEKEICIFGAGSSLGEMSLIDGHPRSASVVTTAPTIILVLTSDSFGRMSREIPTLAVKMFHKIAKLMSERLRQTSGRLIDFLEVE